jgi:oligoendopeptidase F
MTVSVPPRSEIPVEFTWDAYSVYPDDSAWEAGIAELNTLLEDAATYAGKLGADAHTLADWMALYNQIYTLIGKIYIYASLFHDADTNDQTAAARNGRALALFGKVQATTAFMDPELLELGQPTLEAWMQDEPRLAEYGQYIHDLFRRQAHVRSAEVEEVLGLASDPFATASNTAQFLIDSEMTFKPAHKSSGEEVPIAQGNIDSLIMDADREVRRTAWQHYADGYLGFKNTLANNLTAAVKQFAFNARVRRFGSPLEMALEANNIPNAVYTSLMETFRANLPTWHRYWRIRRKALGVDSLHVYDIKAPLTKNRPGLTYPEAIEKICAGMEPLGERYVDVMRRGLVEQRWVDVYPNQGKRNGAFSTGWQGTHPFILMSFTNDIESMSTLAHELGHSMHSWLTWDTQPFIYSNYSLFVAEVASNFNQAIVRDYLLRTETDRDFQIAVIEEAMSNFHRYFFIMPTLARFELELHNRVWDGDTMTADDMIHLMTELYREGYGGEMEIDHERIGITWAQFGHLYAPFYVYQYATGISGAHALAAPILAGNKDAADRYIRFLSAGSSRYALDVLKEAGVDLATPEPVERAFATLAGYVDRLEELVG